MGKFSDVFSILEKEGCEVVKSPCPDPVGEKDLLKIIPEMDAVITGSDEFTAKVIQAADKLKVISKGGVGVEKIDVEAATKKGIVDEKALYLALREKSLTWLSVGSSKGFSFW